MASPQIQFIPSFLISKDILPTEVYSNTQLEKRLRVQTTLYKRQETSVSIGIPSQLAWP